MSNYHKALINKGWPGLLRQELISYEMYNGTLSKKHTTRVFDTTGRYYDSNNDFTFHDGGTTWADSLQNTMLLDKPHLVGSDFTAEGGKVLREKVLEGETQTELKDAK